MNKIILCEGQTDAILLSYYLGKVSGWEFCRKPPKNIAIKEDTFSRLSFGKNKTGFHPIEGKKVSGACQYFLVGGSDLWV